MKLLIIRHGDPDYSIDGLTEKGNREAELLSDRLCKENISAVYCSTLGRARLTAEPTLKKLGLNAKYCEWLREFDYTEQVLPHGHRYPWDVLPKLVLNNTDMLDTKKWRECDFLRNSNVVKLYDNVCNKFDSMLSNHGYERNSICYKANNPNHDTIALFCHYGLGCVLLSHILNCSPYSLWVNTCLPTSSVTTFYTEERCEGTAILRSFGIGDISHLYAAGEHPSFSARFCECFTDDTRHD